MNLKQINILIILGLFLLFDFVAILSYQNLNSSIKLSQEKSEELISTYNVRLNRDQIQQLAAKIGPNPSFMANKVKKPEISIQIPVPKKMPDIKSVGIYLYNGSGTPGEAAAIAPMLENKGYKIDKIDNADQDNYKKTIIRHSSDQEVLAKDLQNVLKSLYNEIIIEIREDQTKIEIVLGEPAQTSEGR